MGAIVVVPPRKLHNQDTLQVIITITITFLSFPPSATIRSPLRHNTPLSISASRAHDLYTGVLSVLALQLFDPDSKTPRTHTHSSFIPLCFFSG